MPEISGIAGGEEARMGMDVYGRSATAEVGQYFRRNASGWPPLADYCEHAAPEIWERVEHPHSNGGSGLGSCDALRLADALTASIRDGGAGEYVRERDKAIAALPWDVCWLCH